MSNTDKAVVVDGIREDVRFRCRPARHQLRRRARGGARLARAQRGRQDDDGGHPVDADAAGSRPRGGRRA